MLRRFVSFLVIETLDSLRHCVGNHRHRVIADHRVGLFTPQFPNRQASALFVDPNESVYEVDGAFLIDDRIQRMRGAERVPEGEDGVLFGLRSADRGFRMSWGRVLSPAFRRLLRFGRPAKAGTQNMDLLVMSSITSIDVV